MPPPRTCGTSSDEGNCFLRRRLQDGDPFAVYHVITNSKKKKTSGAFPWWAIVLLCLMLVGCCCCIVLLCLMLVGCCCCGLLARRRRTRRRRGATHPTAPGPWHTAVRPRRPSAGLRRPTGASAPRRRGARRRGRRRRRTWSLSPWRGRARHRLGPCRRGARGRLHGGPPCSAPRALRRRDAGGRRCSAWRTRRSSVGRRTSRFTYTHNLV